ncbi:tyrosine-protein phosphatase non-receptor type 18 isoform X2 [Parambassis ranga]|uniref:protein-tyrosine-phosphatase n=1 Tax=Parambassis ranga TaxID=210632 RepID=A0A6P7IPW2_9TELE|nr:tyrosine-protein phosphatase non-receptor type 18-like isoform X2 [Parambassis ranga]
MELLPSLLSSLKAVDPGSVEQEYSVLRSRSLALKRDLGLSAEVGALKENIKKNRYKDILPYDQSRVVLSLLTSDFDSDYINASFIKGASADRCYIAAQAPLSSTLTDFWRMIWQHDVRVIVMACREVEMGKRKCESYWAAAHQSASFGAFTVTTGETCPNKDMVIRSLTVTFQQDSRSVVQYQFLSWPDHDVPYETAGVLDLLERVRSSRGANSSPVLIHCSAGCGRTGVICALDYIHDLLVTKRITADFSILSVVLDLRSQRPSAVQTKDQYQFIFTAVVDLLERRLRPAGPQLYSNLSQLDTHETTTPTPAPPVNRPSSVLKMNDTYAVVNKPKQSHPPPSSPAHSRATPRSNTGSRTLPASHHYDNDSEGVSATPIYSTVRPRAKPLSLPHSATPIYDIASPTNRMSGEEPDYQLVSADQPSAADDDYEDFSASDMTSFCSPGGIGFNCRVQKPRGPREPPAEWSRLER